MPIRYVLAFAVCCIASPAASYPGRATAPLPEGRLLALSGNSQGASFVAIDQSSMHGGVVDAWVMRVLAEPVVLSSPSEKPEVTVSQTFSHWKVQCAERTAVELSGDGFDPAGRWRIEGVDIHRPGPPRKIEPNSAQDFLARVYCDGQQPPRPVVVVGHAAAVALMQRVKAGPGS
jgi:hypothetical protein